VDIENRRIKKTGCFAAFPVSVQLNLNHETVQKKDLVFPIWNIYRNPVNEKPFYPLFFHSKNRGIKGLSRFFHSFHRYDYDNDDDYIYYNHSPFSG
jgi:hypothetical protein